MEKLIRYQYSQKTNLQEFLEAQGLDRYQWNHLPTRLNFSNRVKIFILSQCAKPYHVTGLYNIDFSTLNLYEVGSDKLVGGLEYFEVEFYFIRPTICINKFYNIEKEN